MTRLWIAVACAVTWLVTADAALAQNQACKPDSSTTCREVAADPFARLKDIPLSPDGSVSLSLGGQLRIRPGLSRQPVFGLAAPAHNNGLLIRSFLSTELKLGRLLRGFVEFVSGRLQSDR